MPPHRDGPLFQCLLPPFDVAQRGLFSVVSVWLLGDMVGSGGRSVLKVLFGEPNECRLDLLAVHDIDH